MAIPERKRFRPLMLRTCPHPCLKRQDDNALDSDADAYKRDAHPTTAALMQQIRLTPERYANHIEFGYVDNAAHFITDDAPVAVTDLSLNWFQQTN